MAHIWRSPLNDQRPAVLEFLRTADVQHCVTLDIGAGDAYYLPVLRPRKYVAIEPDDVWREQLPCLVGPGVPVRTYRDIAAFLSNTHDIAEIELAVLCHALLYLADGEVHPLLDAIRQTAVVMVHPDPVGATTIAFERFVGWEGSLDRIGAKERTLGPPMRRTSTASSLYLPDTTTLEDVAFLVGHRLPMDRQEGETRAARDYVRARAATWLRDGWWRIPQPQVLEYYTPPSSGISFQDATRLSPSRRSLPRNRQRSAVVGRTT
jgi:hypothetical protein